MDGHLNRWFLDPLLRGRYPDDMLAWYERRYGPLREARNGDLAAIGAPMDFLGVNYYSPQRVFAAPRGGPLELDHAPAAPPLTAMGWEVDPGGLHDLLLRLRRDYGPLPVYITENGASFDDPPATDGLVEDPQRTAYLRGHLEALARGRGWRRRAPLLRVVAARQLRVGARLRQAVRDRPRGLRDAAPRAQAQRALVPRLHRVDAALAARVGGGARARRIAALDGRPGLWSGGRGSRAVRRSEAHQRV
jgi:Glycosyl hydrolase family 1